MERILTVRDMQARAEALRREGKRIGFVPTMGYLHEGHLSLIDEAKKHSDIVVVSVFVNPTQFGPHEDLESYPRDIDRDEALAASRGAGLMFYPSVKEMYPGTQQTWVQVEDLTGVLCGASREGHFRGVSTVVTKLFHIVKPHVAVFGQKDAQQAAVIMKMAADLNMDIRILVAPIVREADGLAMSSRNVRLTPENRKKAVILSQSLFGIREGLLKGQPAGALLEEARAAISAVPGAKLEYLELRSYPALEELTELRGTCLAAVAARFGDVRLIDNVMIKI